VAFAGLWLSLDDARDDGETIGRRRSGSGSVLQRLASR